MRRKHSRVCLGTTRRQKNRGMRNLLITLGLIVAVMILSAFFLSWMLDGENPFVAAVGTAPDSAEMQTHGTAGADAPDTNPAEAMTEAVSQADDKMNTVLPSESASETTGTPYKTLDYTDQWVVMVDAGHGFDDIGTSGALLGTVNEATINLDIALRLQAILEQSGVSVLMTHDTNAVSGRVSVSDGGEMPKNNLVLLTPEDRAALANGQDIDLYVSIHCDSIPDKPEISGMRMYYCAESNPDANPKRKSGANALADSIASGFHQAMGEESDVPIVRALRAEEAYYVIREVNVPSVLCEVGFVTNQKDAAAMLDAAWRERAAKGIADGIFAYIAAATAATEE